MYYFFCLYYFSGSSLYFRVSGLVIFVIIAVSPYILFFLDLISGTQFVLLRCLGLGFDGKRLFIEKQFHLTNSRITYMLTLFCFIIGSRPPFNYTYLFVAPLVFIVVFYFSSFTAQMLSAYIYLLKYLDANIGMSQSESESAFVLKRLFRENLTNNKYAITMAFFAFVPALAILLTDYNIFYARDSWIPFVFYAIALFLFAISLIFYAKRFFINNIIFVVMLLRNQDEEKAGSEISSVKEMLLMQYNSTKFLFILSLLMIYSILLFISCLRLSHK